MSANIIWKAKKTETGIVSPRPFGMQSFTSMSMRSAHCGEPMMPKREGPNVSENPMTYHRSEPITRPERTCMIIDSAFLRRISPACAMPIAVREGSNKRNGERARRVYGVRVPYGRAIKLAHRERTWGLKHDERRRHDHHANIAAVDFPIRAMRKVFCLHATTSRGRSADLHWCDLNILKTSALVQRGVRDA